MKDSNEANINKIIQHTDSMKEIVEQFKKLAFQLSFTTFDIPPLKMEFKIIDSLSDISKNLYNYNYLNSLDVSSLAKSLSESLRSMADISSMISSIDFSQNLKISELVRCTLDLSTFNTLIANYEADISCITPEEKEITEVIYNVIDEMDNLYQIPELNTLQIKERNPLSLDQMITIATLIFTIFAFIWENFFSNNSTTIENNFNIKVSPTNSSEVFELQNQIIELNEQLEKLNQELHEISSRTKED